MSSITTDSTAAQLECPSLLVSAEEQLRQMEPLLDSLSHTGTDRKRTIAVMPAYNAATTIERTLSDIPVGSIDEVILVDDCSTDNTVEVARSLGITVVEREENGGYGANQKMCYRYALEHGADYVVMIHPDFQYDSRLAGIAVDFLKLDICDVVLGSRIRTRQEALDGGMPVWKYVANRILTTVENIALGQNLGDFHSGFRAYSREVLETIPLHENSDDFVFDSPVPRTSGPFRLPHRRRPCACPLFRGSVQHSLPPLCDLRLRNAGRARRVLLAPHRADQLTSFSSFRAQDGSGFRRVNRRRVITATASGNKTDATIAAGRASLSRKYAPKAAYVTEIARLLSSTAGRNRRHGRRVAPMSNTHASASKGRARVRTKAAGPYRRFVCSITE